MTDRIDYDRVAEQYDAQPYRAKGVDPELVAFLADRDPDSARVLDLACGTGNQIQANRARFPSVEFVGVDASQGMLRVARRKVQGVHWVQATADALPLADGVFHFASCQFAYHHFADPRACFAEVARVLGGAGRFALTNVAPHEYVASAFYRAFPEALEIDLRHFLPTEVLRELLVDCGFAVVELKRRQASETTTLGEFATYVSTRSNNSHLTAISDEAYAAGIARVRAWLADSEADAPIANPLSIVTFVADRP